MDTNTNGSPGTRSVDHSGRHLAPATQSAFTAASGATRLDRTDAVGT